jgi:hypothetical protein
MSPVLGQILAPFFLPGLTTPFEKFDTKNELLKAKEPAPDV